MDLVDSAKEKIYDAKEKIGDCKEYAQYGTGYKLAEAQYNYATEQLKRKDLTLEERFFWQDVQLCATLDAYASVGGTTSKDMPSVQSFESVLQNGLNEDADDDSTPGSLIPGGIAPAKHDYDGAKDAVVPVYRDPLVIDLDKNGFAKRTNCSITEICPRIRSDIYFCDRRHKYIN